MASKPRPELYLACSLLSLPAATILLVIGTAPVKVIGALIACSGLVFLALHSRDEDRAGAELAQRFEQADRECDATERGENHPI